MDDSRRTSGTSFADDFDEFDLLLEDDEPVASSKAGRLPSPRSGGSATRGTRKLARPSIRITPDWNRLAAALLVVAVVLFILWFAISSIMGARRDSSYKNYFGDVRTIGSQSTAQGDELESILVDPNGGDRAERIARIEDLAGRADKLVKQAGGLESPKQMVDAHEQLQTSLQYRASGLDALQRSLSASVDAKDKEASSESVAQAFARLIASDVIWADSFAVSARTQLQSDKADGVAVPDSVFFGDFEQLGTKSISSMIDRIAVSTKVVAGGTAPAPKDGKIRGGQLETGQVTVAPSGQTLISGGLTEIKGGDNITFEVPFTNQGEVQLTQVPVKITMRGSESESMVLTGVIDVVDPGQTATAKVSLDEVPNFGEVLDTTILVGPIPGEKTADNNQGTYQLQFAL